MSLYRNISVTHHKRKIKAGRRGRKNLNPAGAINPLRKPRKVKRIRITPSSSRTITDPRMKMPRKRKNELQRLLQ